MEQSNILVMQRKKDVINAVQAGKLTAALDILDKALELAPRDKLLLEFASTFKAAMQDNWSTSEDEDSGVSEADVGTASGSESDDGKAAWKVPGQFDNSTSHASDGACTGSAAAQHSCWATAAESTNHKVHELQPLPRQESAPTTIIRLATSCFTLNVQQRAILRQQLKAGEDVLKTAAMQHNAMTDSPLLSN